MNTSGINVRQVTTGGDRQFLVDNTLVHSYLLVLYSLILPVSAMGVATNIINIKVLLHQNQSLDTGFITLTALSFSDLFSCVFLLPQSTCYFVERYSRVDHFLVKNCVVLASGHITYIHIVFSRITTWITVYLSLERALCVLLPLNVKALFRPRQSYTAIASIFVFFVLFHIPYAVNSWLIVIPDYLQNNSIRITNYNTPLGGVFVKYLNEMVGSCILTTIAILIVAIATAIMLFQLNSARKWRHSLIPSQPLSTLNPAVSAGSTKLAINVAASSRTTWRNSDRPDTRLSHREAQMIKTVVAITTMFIVCSLCGHAPGLAMQFVYEVALTGVNRNLYNICFKVRYLGDTTNASMNMFFYFKMSSKYRQTFSNMFLGKVK